MSGSKKKAVSRADAFTSLLGDLPEAGTPPQTVAVDQIQLRGSQPRRSFDNEGLASLAQSIREQGILQPVLLRPVPGGYELIAGERRLRAARLAGLSDIPAVVREVEERDIPLLAALENLQRQDLNPLDEVEATITLIAQELGIGESEVVPLLHTQRRSPDLNVTEKLERLFGRLGRGSWASFAGNKVGVLKFPAQLLEQLRSGQLEYTRAAALARIKDPERRGELLRRTLEEGLSVSDIAAAAKEEGVQGQKYRKIRTLIDERRISQLGQREQAKVQKLLSELENILETRTDGKRS